MRPHINSPFYAHATLSSRHERTLIASFKYVTLHSLRFIKLAPSFNYSCRFFATLSITRFVVVPFVISMHFRHSRERKNGSLSMCIDARHDAQMRREIKTDHNSRSTTEWAHLYTRSEVAAIHFLSFCNEHVAGPLLSALMRRRSRIIFIVTAATRSLIYCREDYNCILAHNRESWISPLLWATWARITSMQI